MLIRRKNIIFVMQLEDNTMKRREFLRNAAIVAASSGIANPILAKELEGNASTLSTSGEKEGGFYWLK